jgi:hypothetical protein
MGDAAAKEGPPTGSDGGGGSKKGFAAIFISDAATKS